VKSIIGFFIFTTFILSEQISAQTYQLESSLSVRDDNTDFVSADDVTGFVSKGTEFKVLSEKTLRSGAKALEVEFTKLGKGSRLDKDDRGPFYLYKRKNKDFKVINNGASTEAGTTCADGTCGETASAGKQNAVETSREFLRRLEEDVERKANEQALKKAPHSSDELKALIDRYSTSKTVDRMVNWATRNITATRGRGKCYRKAKETLSKNNMSKGPIYGRYARGAIPNLKEHGYINLMESPYNMNYTPESAPKGAVLIYDSARDCDRGNRIVTMGKGCGHIEIKLANGLFSSDYKSTNAITKTGIGRHYRLKAVMIKPDVE